MTTEATATKRNHKPIGERDQDTAELQVMALCKGKIDKLRSGQARVRVCNYLLASMLAKQDQNTPPPPTPRQPNLPHTDPASAQRVGAIGGAEDVP